MENKNLNDIIIEDAETSKGNQLKNILTLLALLFIILVISIVITKLILGGDDDTDERHLRTDATVQEAGESNLTGTISNGVASATDGTGQAMAVAGAALAGAAATVALTSKNADAKKEDSTQASVNVRTPILAERNTTSRTKVPLRTEQPAKSNTKSASTQSETAKKKASSSSSRTSHSTYTRPKYVKKKTTPTRSTTRTATITKSTSSKKITRGYYIKVGTYDNPSTAIRNIKAIKLNYKTTKTKQGLTRVLIGPFYSKRDAQNHLSKAKSSVASDAYIAKIK
ncbi:MAG TPA: SPOR domain-containing protein [Campylobacterales bacterium]|nr:SPOR domain-containing protein [Campylobacterales bacterium]